MHGIIHHALSLASELLDFHRIFYIGAHDYPHFTTKVLPWFDTTGTNPRHRTSRSERRPGSTCFEGPSSPGSTTHDHPPLPGHCSPDNHHDDAIHVHFILVFVMWASNPNRVGASHAFLGGEFPASGSSPCSVHGHRPPKEPNSSDNEPTQRYDNRCLLSSDYRASHGELLIVASSFTHGADFWWTLQNVTGPRGSN